MGNKTGCIVRVKETTLLERKLWLFLEPNFELWCSLTAAVLLHHIPPGEKYHMAACSLPHLPAVLLVLLPLKVILKSCEKNTDIELLKLTLLDFLGHLPEFCKEKQYAFIKLVFRTTVYLYMKSLQTAEADY